MEVLRYLEIRSNYALQKSNNDDWITEINNSDLQEEVFIVVPEGFLFALHNNQRDEFEKKYNIAGVFDLSIPYVSMGVHMVLVHAVSSPVTHLKVGNYIGEIYEKRKYSSIKGTFHMPTKYYRKFLNYISNIETWINNGIMPDDDPAGQYEFNLIPINEVNSKRKDPGYYTKRTIEVREMLKEEDTYELCDVAEVLSTKEERNSCEQVPRLKISELKYPLDIFNIGNAKPTNVVMKKGDILFPLVGNGKPFLFMEESEEQIYAPPYTAVIKCKKILPEYLYLFLCSDTAVNIMNATAVGTVIRKLKIDDLLKLPIPKPTLAEEKYRLDFEILTSTDVRKYGSFNAQLNSEIEKYQKLLSRIQNKENKAEVIEDVFNVEMVSKIKVHNEEQLRKLLIDDMNELNTCYKGKAYKATLILAGSILEAVLIDWLSEIHHKDYFASDFYVYDKRKGRQKKAELIDYIDEIKYLQRPSWVAEAGKAHNIRKKRNLVHAKLCINSDEVNQDTCKMVIGYLKDVLKTRGITDFA